MMDVFREATAWNPDIKILQEQVFVSSCQIDVTIII